MFYDMETLDRREEETNLEIIGAGQTLIYTEDFFSREQPASRMELTVFARAKMQA
jgi:hypothetical protein